MKRILLAVCAAVCMASACHAQENEAITKALKDKYGFACYHDNDGGWYGIKKDGKYGACDLQGNEVIHCEYQNVNKGKKYYRVIKDNKAGLYDYQGNVVISCITVCNDFNEERSCFIAIRNGKNNSMKEQRLGLFSKDGKLLLSCEYTFLTSFNYEKGIYLIGKGGRSESQLGYFDYPFDAKFALYDVRNEKFITQFIYDYIDYQYGKKEKLARYNIGGKIVANTEDYNAVVEGGKWGYLDETGKEVIPVKYTNATPFKDGVAQVTEKGVTSLIANPLLGGTIYARTDEAVAIDTQIPETKKTSDESFAFILSNENYGQFSRADHSINDGKIFAEYCKKTLGMSENNVRYYEDATYGNMLKAIKQIKDIADVYDGEAKIIFYFSGLGMADEKSGKRYILPSDASVSALSSTALSLDDLLGELNRLNTKYTMAVVDAPFNGMDKNGKAIGTGRGVKISSKSDEAAAGNVILVVGSENGSNNYSSKKFGHGLLTYSLLSQLKQTKGGCTIGSLLETMATDVKKESLNQFKEVQRPTIKVSEQIKDKLQTLKL